MIRLMRVAPRMSNRIQQMSAPVGDYIVESDPSASFLLDQYLSFQTGLARSDIERISRARRLVVNGKRVRDLNISLFPGDTIRISRHDNDFLKKSRQRTYENMTLYNGTEFCVTTDQQRNLTIVAPDQITFHALQDSIFAPYIPISISRRSENNSYKPHRSVEKSYLAVVCGLPIAAEGTIKYSIMAVDDFAQLKIVKPAQITPYAYSNIYAGETNYEIIGSIDKLGSVLKITTRRPFFSYTDASENMMGENVIRGQAALNMEVEQIKVHLSSLKMPILGDKIYGIKSYRSLHLQGWGHYVDFTKSHGVKALPGGLPLFLHLRDLRFLGFGDKDNVTVTNPLPDIWRALFKSANILLSR